MNIRFNHGFEVFNILLWPEVDINARREGPQQPLNTSNPWLNVIITLWIYFYPFICLFSTVIPLISPSFVYLYRDNIIVYYPKVLTGHLVFISFLQSHK